MIYEDQKGKCVLMITTSFPPYCSIAGVRMGCFVKYLQKYGWNTIVYCPINWDLYDREIVSNLFVDKVYRLKGKYNSKAFFTRVSNTIKRRFPYDYYFYGYFPLVKYLNSKSIIKKIINSNKIDVILSSYPFPISFGLANWASKRFGIPWVADFRDILEEFLEGDLLKYVVNKEKSTVQKASRIITVSYGLKRILDNRYNMNIDVIHNGYDPDDYKGIKIVRPNKFTITYTGGIYLERDPTILLKCIDDLISEDYIKASEIELKFYSASKKTIHTFMEGIVNKDIIKIHPRKTRKEIINIQMNSNLLILLGKKEIEGCLTGKLFEYLAAKRPIVSISRDSEIDYILKRANAGESFESVVDIRKYIYEKYIEWKTTGKVAYNGRIDHLKEYRRDYQGKQLAEILNEVIRK